MSYYQFLIRGLAGDQQQYLRTNHAPDEVAAVHGQSGFQGDVFTFQNLGGNQNLDRKSLTIDSVIQVNTVSDQIRSDNQSFWHYQRKQSKITFIGTLIGGVSSVFAAVAANAAFPPMLGVVILTSFLALAFFSVSGLSFYRYLQASNEYKKWDDPIPGLIEQRKQAGMKGYQYAYKRQLKGKLVTQQEIQELWYADMEKAKADFFSAFKPLSALNGEKVRKFFQNGLLSNNKLSYAFSDQVPDQLLGLSQRYEQLFTQYALLQKCSEQQLQAINQQRNGRLLENDRQRDWQLIPWRQWFDVNYRQPLLKRRNCAAHNQGIYRRGERQIPGHDAHQRNRNLDWELKRLEGIYLAMTAPIYALHERNRQSINSWADREIQQLKNNQNHQLQCFTEPVIDLIKQFEAIQCQERSFYAQNQRDEWGFQEFSYPNIYESYSPSAPDLEADYQAPQYREEWKETIGKVDWEKKVVEVTTRTEVYMPNYTSSN